MPTATYIALANLTLTATATNVTFSSIPATYRDLVIVYNGQTQDSGGNDLQLRMNGDLNTYTTEVTAYGDGSSTGSFTQNQAGFANFGAGNRTTMIANIMDYSVTDKHKTALIRAGSQASYVVMVAMRYAQTTAITSVEVWIGAGSFSVGSTFALYGIEA